MRHGDILTLCYYVIVAACLASNNIMLVSIRSKEIHKWRKTARSMVEALSEMEETAKNNDLILLVLHKISLILIKKEKNWERQIEHVLSHHFNFSECALKIFPSPPSEISRLPLRGQISTKPLACHSKTKKSDSYFHLPLVKNKKKIAVLTMASTQENAFPADAARDFMQRLSQLISAVL